MKKIIISFGCIIGLIIYSMIIIHEFNTLEVEFAKDYVDIYVEIGDIVDCGEMRKPSEKYKALGLIRGDARLAYADYMEENNLKLSEGKQKVYRMEDVSVEKLIETFKTEKFEQNQNNNPADPDKEIEVFVNGKKLQLELAPIILKERTMLPAQAVFAALGAKVLWSKDANAVIAEKEDVKITLPINSSVIYKNDEMIELDAQVTLYNDEVFVPLMAVSEGLDKKVIRDISQRTITIN